MVPSPLAVACRYRYDPLDRLASSQPSNQTEVQAFYQKSRLATEIQGSLQRTLFQHDDYLLAQQQRNGSTSQTSLLVTDQQRSVLQRSSATERESLVYTAYGHHPADSGLSCLPGFNGERRDPLTGHYLLGNGYRAFNPVLMRFNSPDSLSPFGEGGVNAYAYCQGDPVNFSDPTGHITSRFWGGVAKVGFLKVKRPKGAPLKRLGRSVAAVKAAPGFGGGANLENMISTPVSAAAQSPAFSLTAAKPSTTSLSTGEVDFIPASTDPGLAILSRREMNVFKNVLRRPIKRAPSDAGYAEVLESRIEGSRKMIAHYKLKYPALKYRSDKIQSALNNYQSYLEYYTGLRNTHYLKQEPIKLQAVRDPGQGGLLGQSFR